MIYKGIFWIKDINDIRNTAVCIKEKCGLHGIFAGTRNMNENMLSKSKDNFNHQKAWNSLSKAITENKPYNYYPRGRVEIRNAQAVIFANGNIASERLKDWAVQEFGLTRENGIKAVTLKTDMSKHYLCCLDRDI